MGANSSSIRAGAAFVELKSKDSGFSRSLKRAQRRLDRFGAAARKVGTGLLTGGGSIVAAGAIAARVFAKLGDELDKTSKRTGFSVEALSELGFAAEQSGSDLKTLEKGIKSMQRSINDAGRGLSTQVDALDDLGLSYRDLASLSPEDQFALIAERIGGVEDPTKRAALAMQLLGRAGQQLLPLFEGGAGGMEKLRQQARDLGIVVSAEAATAAAEMTDELNITKRVIKALVFEVGAALAPAIVKTTKIVTRIVAGASGWVKQNQKIIRTVAMVAGAVVGVGGLILGLGLVAGVVAFAVGGLASAMAFMGTIAGVAGAALAALLSPIGLVIAGVAGLAAFIAAKSVDIGGIVDNMASVFKGLAGSIAQTLGAITNSVIAGDLELAVKIAGKGMELAWAATMKGLRGQLLDFKAFAGRTLIDLGFFSIGGLSKENVKKLFDKGVKGERSSIESEIVKLTNELELLRNQVPDNPIGGLGASDLFKAYQGFAQATSRAGTSARGIFQSSALKSLSSPVEKSIEENTAKTAQSVAQIARSVKNGGLRFT